MDNSYENNTPEPFPLIEEQVDSALNKDTNKIAHISFDDRELVTVNGVFFLKRILKGE